MHIEVQLDILSDTISLGTNKEAAGGLFEESSTVF